MDKKNAKTFVAALSSVGLADTFKAKDHLLFLLQPVLLLLKSNKSR
jgi:hypothetical protein